MLPKFQAADPVAAKDFSMLQTNWASQIDPVLSRPQNSSNILSGVKLVIGSNTINHRLGKKLQGWKTIMQNAAASLYDAQDTNQTPELTLILVSSAVVTVSLEVF